MLTSTKKDLFIFFLLVLFYNWSACQACYFSPLKQFSTADNLSHNGVTTIFEDSYGYIWLGTYDGLNKYDGYTFKEYRNNLENQLLLSNRVLSINEDIKGKLWIGTEYGVNILDLKTDQISTVYGATTNKQKLKRVTKIITLNSGEVICLVENSALLHFDSNYSLIGTYTPNLQTNESFIFNDMILINDEKLAISTSKGLLIFNCKTKKYKQVFKDNIGPCFGIYKDNNKRLFVLKSHGIAYIELLPNPTYQFTLFKDKRYKYISIDNEGTLWLGAVSGVVKIKNFNPNKPTNQLKLCALKTNEIYVSSISTNIKGRCWITTFNKGLYEFEIANSGFKSYNKSEGLTHGIETNNVVSLTPFNGHSVLISTYFGKISLFDLNTKTFLPLPFKRPPQGTEFTGIIYKDSQNNIWFSPRGTQMGLFLKKHNETEFKLITSSKYSNFNNAQIRLITEDQKGYIWVADKRSVYRLSPTKNSETFEINNLNKETNYPLGFPYIRYIYPDPTGNYVWLGSETNGLYRLQIANDKKFSSIKVSNYQSKTNDTSISSNYVSCILRDHLNQLWVATDQGGITKVTQAFSSPKFITYSERDGLINNGVKRIECDVENNLWLSTNAGINKFITKTKEFRKYQKDDGLPFLNFEFASTKLNDGTMLFGGREGFVYFKPQDIKKVNNLPKLELGDFTLFNKVIKPGDSIDDRVILEKKLALMNHLNLNYDQNVFSIEATSLHFKSPKAHLIRHRLVPINKDWIITPSEKNMLHFNGLPPGEYTLEVAASNRDNIWGETKKLNIIITPHILRTHLAYTLYIVLGLAILILIIQLYLRSFKLQHKLEIEQLEKRQEMAISEEKLRFFTNISHEFRTPLTLIIGPLEMFLDRFKHDQTIRDYLNLVKRQSKKILQLVEESHDFRKAEKNLLQIKESKFNFTRFLKKLTIDFQYLAKNSNKTLELITPHEDIFVIADKNMLQKILNNLINNAFKFTRQNDTIKIECMEHDGTLSCSIKDSGIGISKEDLPFVFERFYQSNQNSALQQVGSGIGLAYVKKLIDLHQGELLVNNEKGNGTEFIFKIPIGNLNEYKKRTDILTEIIKEEKSQKYQHPVLFNEEFDFNNFSIDDEVKNEKVFVVEDNDDMRHFLENVLSQYFAVELFSNGQECLLALDKEWPNLIISDVMMPLINGIELCKSVKTDIKTSHIPVILLTAVSSLQGKLEGIGIGADAYINKPFHVKHLVTQSISLLKTRKQLRERFQIDFPHSIEKHRGNDNDKLFVRKLFDLIDKNIDDQEFDINSLAKELCVSRSQLFEKTKALTNKTPYEVIKIYRLRKAAELLITDKFQVAEVAVKVGFKSLSHFNRAFKAKYTVTPGKYKSTNKFMFNEN
ncbi:two-component regulator propeller domain-containing protein [Tamlana sp. 2_MG-2023]|uniref:hybrid sensor histidine kinase/response regulator n=1 Tax=unclassified Tamlana TaxID=2614803 RepID=UPI0026E27945|nr:MULTISPECIES: two-component regulator propeller domain-containing protein [unclassified Tamlana]MDO6760566.1 two-component regulator propeller domain-containing protein [Tamlana sp. 2_MG-2023]MDO6790822.1 two-component regulator propeller domain-containing protein [Tamlana sp. 1_MG-2023]